MQLHIDNRPAVSDAMRKFLYHMANMDLIPSKGEDGRWAWRRQGDHGMSVVVYNALDPLKPDLAQPCRLAMNVVAPNGEVVVDLTHTYPSSAGIVLKQLVEMTDAMSFHKPEPIDGYQPPARLVLTDDPDFYLTVVPNAHDAAPDARPSYMAYGVEAEGMELEMIGEFPSAYRAFGMLERAAHDRRHADDGPAMRM